MLAKAIKTRKITADSCTLLELLDESLKEFPERGVLAVTSKIVSLCEGRTRPVEGTDLQALVREESELYMARIPDWNGYTFTIANNALVPNSGIDESNGAGAYVLWPSDPWKTANQVRSYLAERFGAQDAGVIIVDRDCLPLRWGSTGLTLAYSGFKPLRDYAGQSDLFGRKLKFTHTNVADCLATVATLLMGEGSEQTPLAVIGDLDVVEFVHHDPAEQEIAARYLSLDDDFYAPFLKSVEWRPGGAGNRPRS